MININIILFDLIYLNIIKYNFIKNKQKCFNMRKES